MSEKKLIHGHTLEYWKENAEEDYIKVPISVLKYITCLEEALGLSDVRKPFFTRLKIRYYKFYYKWFLAESKTRFANKPNTLELSKRFYRYKMYLLNK